MDLHRSFTKDFEDLYEQVQNGFNADNPRPNLDQGYLPHPRSDRDDSRSNPRPLPNPYGMAQSQPRPLPRPPPQSGTDSELSQYYASGSSRTPTSPTRGMGGQESISPSQGIKRLPAVPLTGASSSNYVSPTSQIASSYFDDTPRPETYEKGRGAALYASVRPGARDAQQYSGVPVIDVAHAENGYGASNGSSATGVNRNRSPFLGPTPLIPPGSTQYASDTKTDPFGDPTARQPRPLPTRTPSHTARSMSTNTFDSVNSATGSNRFYDSPSTASPLNRHLSPTTAHGDYQSMDDFDTSGIGATLLRNSSATSSISESSRRPMLAGSVDSTRVSSSGASLNESLSSYNRFNQSPVPQIRAPSHVPSGIGYDLIPPSGSDVKVSLDSYDSKTARPWDESGGGMGDDRAMDHLLDIKRRLGKLEVHDPDQDAFDGVGDDDYFDEEDEDDSRFINLALLSHIAVRLRDKVPRATHVKGSIPYPRAFTGKDIVSTIQSIIQREILITLGISTNDRRIALQVARSLQNQLFFYEVEWGGRTLSDSVEDVYMFLDDEVPGEGEAGPSNGLSEGFTELPTGVITVLTKCYSPSCGEGGPCYSYSCPKRGNVVPSVILESTPSAGPEQSASKRGWKQTVTQEVIDSIGEREVRRQNIIHKMIEKEEQFVQDLEFIDTYFIKALRKAEPPIVPAQELESLIDDIFGNILDLRETNKRLLENMYVRQREQKPVIQKIGDIFLTAAAEFRWAYPVYIGHLPVAEKRLKDELESNAEFRLFLESVARLPESRRLDLKHFIGRPSDHLRNYPVLLDATLKETDSENPDVDFLSAAAQAIRNLSSVAQLRTFQNGMARNPNGPKDWHQLVSKEILEATPKKEQQRQSVIFELIFGEMEFVRDLETIETLFIRPLRAAAPAVIPRDRLNAFIRDVFWTYNDVLVHHRKLLDRLHEIQREEHPSIRSVTAPIYDAALNWQDAYMEYVPHYPIAAFRIQEELGNNPAFKAFHDTCLRNPDSRKLDLKAFIFRPIPRLLRYDLLLGQIKKMLPPEDEDLEAIVQVCDIIKDLAKATESGVATAEKKVELWNFHANLVFKPGEAVDMDLLDETRQLVHTGKLLRPPDGNFELSGWTELFVILFDNYLVMTKTKERDGITKYYANKRPIPLELLSLVGFTEVQQQRSAGIFGRGLKGAKEGKETKDNAGAVDPNGAGGPEDSRTVWPCSIHHAGRVGGLYHLFAESAAVRGEWKQKLEEAIALRNLVNDSNKVFEMRNLSENTFVVPSIMGGTSPGWSNDVTFTGKVTCSVPFSTADGRGLVAVGCAEGVWIGLRSDKNSLRRVLHLKMVTQCAMLEDFGIFLVLADKSLFAYHIEALVPSPNSPHAGGSRTPQKLNGTKDVQFFSVGTLNGRTLIIYMKKKGMDSVFRVLEPVIGKITEKAKAPATFGRNLFGGSRSEWFRVYRDFFLPSESYDLLFLKAKIAIPCTKGFEIMDLTDFKSVTIPTRDDPRLASIARRLENCKAMGMFRTSENEFLLCYDEFGLFVDRHGDPNRVNGVVEWEGTAERVAFHPPYVIIFDSRFVEIRHVDKGRLVQIIRGADIRCLWDGRGASLPAPVTPGPGGWDEMGSLEARIHAVMRDPNSPPNSKVVVQHVFELVPTVPLYTPPPLSAPAAGGQAGNYYQQQQHTQYIPQPQVLPQQHQYSQYPQQPQQPQQPQYPQYQQYPQYAGSPPHSPDANPMQTWR
ncbi:hypothetical protein FRC05_000516 [Tulasnella sp. 425]|nr:hypothetical protein FRC05_000516 [Tulasnella sp. 425]